MISCQEEPYPEIPSQAQAPKMTFTDAVINIGVGLKLYQRWCDHVASEIDRRIELIDATRA